MEKISIQSTYTQVSLYARLSGPASGKKALAGPDDGATAQAGSADPKSGECARSKDGDTFSLSIEARTIQISRSTTIESDGNGTSAQDGAAADKGTAASGQENLTGSGLVHALMDALQTIREKTQGGKEGHTGKHRHHFPQLSDPDDVAGMLLSRLDADHAAKGGSKEDFAADIKKRLDGWKSSSSSKITVEYQEFRSEVHLKMTRGLDAWAGGDAAGGGITAGDGNTGVTGGGAAASGGSASDAGQGAASLTEI